MQNHCGGSEQLNIQGKTSGLNSPKVYSVESDFNVNDAIAGRKKLCTRDRYAKSSSVVEFASRNSLFAASRSLFCFKNVIAAGDRAVDG